MTPEGIVKKAVKKLLDSYGCWYFLPVSNGLGRVGIPDFIVCLPNGKFLAVETKAPGKRGNLTPNQARNIDAINAVGGVALVIDDPEELKWWLVTHA